MKVVVSPYHLTTREVPAMAALLLADRVYTLVPASIEDASPQASRQAAARSPWYARFMETWSWTVPLWEEGVLASRCESDELASEMRHVADCLQNDERFMPLRPLMREELYESDHTYLSSLGADLLRGGPDPGITVPLAAALDRFARRHELCVARAHAVSIVQKAEAQFASNLCAVAVPVLQQASGEHILFAREVLEPELRTLRERVTESLSQSKGRVERDLTAAAGDYARAFDAHADDLAGTADDEVRAVVGSVVVAAVSMPADVVLRSSLIAVEALGTARSRSGADAAMASLSMPVLSADAGSVVSLVIKPMGAPVRRR